MQEPEGHEVPEEIRGEDQQVVGGGSRRQLRHQLLVLADEGQADHLDVGAKFALHGVGVPAEGILVLAGVDLDVDEAGGQRLFREEAAADQ